MVKLNQQSSVAFFDELAEKWDSFHDLKSLALQLDSGLEKLGVQPDEHVLDVGCGTGNLTLSILNRLSLKGKVTAIDPSTVMIDKARSKTDDTRVKWLTGAVETLDFDTGTFDRIICYSVWPHLTDKELVANLFLKWLKSGSKLHIWHTISRNTVNKIHSSASPAIINHLLAPATQIASLLEKLGYSVIETIDNDTKYLVTGCKN